MAALDEQAWNIVSATLFLALSWMAALSRHDRATRSLALLTAVLCGYTSFEVVGNILQIPALEWLENAFASLVFPPLMSLVLSHVGARVRYRREMILTNSVSFALAGGCLLPFLFPSFEFFPGSACWAFGMLLMLLPGTLLMTSLLLQHIRETDGEERMRTLLLSAGLLVGIIGASTDLVALLGAHTTRLAAPMLVLSACILAALVLRFRLLSGLNALISAYAFAIACGALLLETSLFYVSRGQGAAWIFGSLLVMLLALSSLRPVLAILTRDRAQNDYLATMGRMSAQIAHDIKNPIAAIRGAAQFLEADEHDPERRDFLQLIVQQSDRMTDLIDRYGRLGRVAASRRATNLHALVETVLVQQRQIAPTEASLKNAVAEDLPTQSVDPELLASCLENLVKNAVDAAHEVGVVPQIVVAAELPPHLRWLDVLVTDNGPGIPKRDREHVLEDFFTSKADGTGLGLPFAQRIALAHEGRLSLESVAAGGTCVRVRLALARDFSSE